MARDVAGEIAAAAVPAVVRFRFARESGALAIVGEHPVRIEPQQVARHQLLRVLERPAREPYRRQGERPGADRAPPRLTSRARRGGERLGEPPPREERRRASAEAELQGVTARQRHGHPPAPGSIAVRTVPGSCSSNERRAANPLPRQRARLGERESSPGALRWRRAPTRALTPAAGENHTGAASACEYDETAPRCPTDGGTHRGTPGWRRRHARNRPRRAPGPSPGSARPCARRPRA